jgi:hypothetical protein
VVPDDLLEFAHVEVPAVENIVIMGEGAAQHLGLHVFPGQKKLNGGIRAEVSVDYPHKQGDTVRYAWRFMVPKGFVSDAPKNRWWIIGQWHDQPDRARGESWDGFDSKSPPVLLGLGELQGKLGIGIAYGPDQPPPARTCTTTSSTFSSSACTAIPRSRRTTGSTSMI